MTGSPSSDTAVGRAPITVLLLSVVALVVVVTTTTTTSTIADGTNRIRKLFVVCNPAACSVPNCDQETQVAYQSEGECCAGCLDIQNMDCETCPGGFTKLLDDGNCQDCSCFGTTEMCTDLDDASTCATPTCGGNNGGFGIVSPVPPGSAFDCSNCVGHTHYFDGCRICQCSAGERGPGACPRMECPPAFDGGEQRPPYCIENVARSGGGSMVEIDLEQKVGTPETGEGGGFQIENDGSQ